MLIPQINMKEDNNFWGLGVGLEKADRGLYFWQWGDYGLHKSNAKLINSNPLSEIWLLAIGDEFLKNKRYSDAAAVYGIAATDYPTSYKAFYKLGASHMLAGNKEPAIKNFEKSLQINPQNKIAEDNLIKLKGGK